MTEFAAVHTTAREAAAAGQDLATQIQAKMDLYLQPGLRLTIVRKNSIDRPQSGKLKHFYSELS